MKITHRWRLLLALPALAGMLAYGSGQQPAAGAKSQPASPPPAGWKAITNDAKTCRLSLPPAWVRPDSDGIWGRMDKGEMAMFIEDPEAQQAADWGPVHKMIDRRKSTGAKVEILEESPARIIFQSPQGSLLAVMSFHRSPKRLCAVQIAVAAGDPALEKIARQIAGSLTPIP